MTLRIYEDLEQGSDAWLEARCGMLTASNVGKLLTATGQIANNDTSRGLTETLVAERITGTVDYVHPNFDMQLGTLNEPYARDFYSEHYGQVVEAGFAVNEFNGHKLGASPDGLLGSDGGVEFKSRRPKIHLRTILSNQVPAENIDQIQTLMLVWERSWWKYVSYCGGYPLHVIHVEADLKRQAIILDAHRKFEDNAAVMEADYRAITEGRPVAPLIDHFAEIEIAA